MYPNNTFSSGGLKVLTQDQAGARVLGMVTTDSQPESILCIRLFPVARVVGITLICALIATRLKKCNSLHRPSEL